MTIVLDSSVLIDQLRKRKAAIAAIDAAMKRGERITGSVLTRAEVLAGMRSSERRDTHAVFALVDWVEVGEELADRAGGLARRFRASHPGIDIVDYVVAATAQELGAELWTRNVKHFPMFPELRAPY